MQNDMKSAFGRKTKKGFTLIELVVVMAIIAVLALLVVAAITAARRQSIEAQNRNNARSIELALEGLASRNNGAYDASTAADGDTAEDLLKVGGKLVDYAGNWKAGACTNGGAELTTLARNTFTITIYDHTCVITTNIGTIER